MDTETAPQGAAPAHHGVIEAVLDTARKTGRSHRRQERKLNRIHRLMLTATTVLSAVTATGLLTETPEA